MKVKKGRVPPRRHRGSLRTKQRTLYVEAALAAAHDDPDMSKHVALLGGLFPSRKGKKVTVAQLRRALGACHPSTGKLLRKRVNVGHRREGDSLVSNVCHGFDIPLSVDKSVTIAALVFQDDVVLAAAMNAMRQAARWLSKRTDRRLRRGGQNATVETGEGAVFFIPEKAGRDGQPQLHAHLVIPNLTSFEEEGRTRFCAAHFRRITRSAAKAQQRMNAQLGRTLKKAGYAVEVEDGVCRLPNVPRALCEDLSPVSARLQAGEPENTGHRRRSTAAAVRRRENNYLHQRPKKVLQPLVAWRAQWERQLGSSRLRAEVQAYRNARHQPSLPPASVIEKVVPFTPVVEPPLPAVAALSVVEPRDDVLDEGAVLRPGFASVGVSLRRKLENELSHEARNQVIEIDYLCPESARNLVEHTEALRTLLRLIFPRLIVHQKFAATQESGFKVKGGAAANPRLAHLIAATAHALEMELGQDVVTRNWPAVLRWLHAELANRPPEATVPVKPRIKSPAPAKQAIQKVSPAGPQVAPVPAPTPPSVDTPVVDSEPEMEILL